ncbi:MAG TPA: VOC family protein, partial [Actinoplanes sp.]|nr:VOC family protein [Actinoplanes sp.]
MTQMMEHATDTADVFPVQGVDYLQFLVGNAKQAAHYYSTTFGMTCVAYRGPEQGYRDHAEYVLVSGAARFLITGAVHAGAPGAEHVAKHSDGIHDIALAVPDVDAAFRHAISAGARAVSEPHDLTDKHGTVRLAAIGAYGDTIHTLIDRSRYDGPFVPGFVARDPIVDRQPA